MTSSPNLHDRLRDGPLIESQCHSVLPTIKRAQYQRVRYAYIGGLRTHNAFLTFKFCHAHSAVTLANIMTHLSSKTKSCNYKQERQEDTLLRKQQ